MSQSPSLRGSGRFSRGGPRPIQIGSFQSPSLRGSGRFADEAARAEIKKKLFQSPSLRGSGRFSHRDSAISAPSFVSIPFIAGQWSLQEQARREAKDRERFNPLHCGAVVASIGREG